MDRIGLFGGTFNPIHCGHLEAANGVKQAFGLTTVYLILSAVPPHKTSRELAEAETRLDMARLAVENHSFLSISDLELKREGPSFTIDTVRFFKKYAPAGTRLYWILGLDAFLEIDTWKSYMDLFHAIPFIVMARPGTAGGPAAPWWKDVERFLRSRISTGYTFSPENLSFTAPESEPVYLFEGTPLNISSTDIRRRISSGQSIHSLVPPRVEDYINDKRIYR